MRFLFPVLLLLLPGCLGTQKIQVARKEVTMFHVGFGLCACFLRVEDLAIEAEKVPTTAYSGEGEPKEISP